MVITCINAKNYYENHESENSEKILQTLAMVLSFEVFISGFIK